MKLLDQFLDEDATPQVRRLLLETTSALGQSKEMRVRQFTFNRFNVQIDSGKGIVTLQDDLDVSEGGEVEIKLSVFAAALRQEWGRKKVGK